MSLNSQKEIEGFPGYTVCSNGVILGKSGKPIGLKQKKRIPSVCLLKDGKSHWRQINKLVANSFLENREGFLCLGHKDGNIENCESSNLFWKPCGPLPRFTVDELYRKKKLARIKRIYGLPENEYLNLLERQRFKCAICGKPEEESRLGLLVDHAHKKSDWIPEGAVRGLLCWDCNHRLIGNLTDPTIFEKAAEYLKTYLPFFAPPPKPKRRKKNVKR